MAVKKGFWYRLSLAAVPPLYMGLTRFLFATCRVREQGLQHFDQCSKADQPYIAAFWHYGIFYIIHRAYEIRRKLGHPWVAMLSASDDAEYVAGVFRKMDIDLVRGSRGKGKGGLAALKNMITMVKEGRNAGIVADGSQGPARQVQAGMILLASKTGTPILPVAWGADRYIAFKSWDRTVLPKPFARIDMWYGEPLTVPAKLKSEDLEKYRLELENRLNELYDQAWGEFGRKEH